MDVELRDARVPLLRELDRPSVLVGFPGEPAGLTCVGLDFFRAGVACAEHLADLGHREIALVGAPPAVYERGTGFAQRTLAGFREAATRRGVRRAVVACEESLEAVRHQLAQLFTKRPGLTGLVVHNGPPSATSSPWYRRSAAACPTTSRWWRSDAAGPDTRCAPPGQA